MFASRHRGTVIAEGLKIVGSVTAEGLVEVNGQIEGELHCTSLVISRKAHVSGAITAEQVVVDGTVEGPIQGRDVVLKSRAHVVGDIQHQTLAIEKGAYFEGRSVRARESNEHRPERVGRKPLKEAANDSREAAAERPGSDRR
jgi:cytoskeletal protein CcmA (bactofilin family)